MQKDGNLNGQNLATQNAYFSESESRVYCLSLEQLLILDGYDDYTAFFFYDYTTLKNEKVDAKEMMLFKSLSRSKSSKRVLVH